ncbi:tRNA epoxyqueuosine(34) reductase QueG [Longimicrobium terrae]|uniref:Epoxyqueuosine reductase n=1 Tax=Longimicrobium terrae TaxID=1639882 RepID=A0A841H365_9BACT|nr:tRNA epoxyqueuosine(34) reductase QueG [Longimicrobium terrae]MBB4637866.1 epoxyqueuosine reductase [Longimicrobium terrae]MBB6072279.1 epoxyqueuosine reductase [Longimicrobium terrae]NNC31201.1 tRNA epoxyqueuosine(34) reductase QueG [Longimicrobium terrae]
MSATLSPDELSERIRVRAREMGFGAVGVAPVHASAHGDAYERWIAQEMHGDMAYLAREDAVAKRRDPAVLVPGARSAVVVGLEYFNADADPSSPLDPARGVVARYARNDDYHDLMKERLIQLQDWINDTLLPVHGRAYVDTGALLERELASRAGLGWHGRNTMLIQPRRGSYWFLGAILLDVELDYDAPFATEHCGTCSACLTACPTNALLGRDETGAPRMDARRCISYLTIELRGPIPRDLRPAMGNRVYGCDICQEVCPFNNSKFVRITREPAFLARAGLDGPSLIEWMGMSQEDFSRRFKNSPIKRAKRRGLLRNVAVALGNWGALEAVPALAVALHDDEPLVRGHAAWALGRIGTEAAWQALAGRAGVEEDAWVGEEIAAALRERTAS